MRRAWMNSICRWTGLVLLVVLAGGLPADEPAGSFPKITNTQELTQPLLTPAEALRALELPTGFHATLFAAEPAVQQPIGFCTDVRGRLWVAENYTYSDRTLNFDLNLRDRIVILEDADGDGEAEKRTVFWDEGRKLTSVETGFGGVWALCPPQLLFIPDRDGNDRPDGPAEVVLDGWDHNAVRHNIANGLKWGPDGWLYGRHGILATSLVGAPGTRADQRTPINCGMWRYHPTRKVFEAVAHGTTNPWGHDWDENGQLFFINTVIGHLWHVIPGAHYRRMYGEHLRPHLYDLIEQTADHFHWDTREVWSDIRTKGVTPSTDAAGGGHAHSGLMIYQGDNWPAEYRGGVFTVNLHGHRLNHDRLERHGASYIAEHGPDLLKTKDHWFRAVDLTWGADGAVYIADWSDIGECHENDGVHRTSGRIFKVSGGSTKSSPVPRIDKLSNQDLIGLLDHANDWYPRMARRVLQERAAAHADLHGAADMLLAKYDSAKKPPSRLRYMWALNAIGAADDTWLVKQLSHEEEHIRVWAVKLLADRGSIAAPIAAELIKQAERDTSGLVRLFLISTLPLIPAEQRWDLADRLANFEPGADDAVYPRLLWQCLEPEVTASPDRAVAMAFQTNLPTLGTSIARRLTYEQARLPQGVNALVAGLSKYEDNGRFRYILLGMSQALRGMRKSPAPAGWAEVSARLSRSKLEDNVTLSRELSVVFGDGRAVDELRQIVNSADADLSSRRAAIRTLAEANTQDFYPVLKNLLGNRDLAADAVRAMASYSDAEIPQLLINSYANLVPAAREQAINTLCARPVSAELLLDAVQAGRIDRAQIPVHLLRQLQSLKRDNLSATIAELWPELKSQAADKVAKIDALRNKLNPATLAAADLPRGRTLFAQQCAKCHRLFGEGSQIGPELTGAQRGNLTYLLENIVDPSATLASNFRISIIELKSGRVLSGLIVERTEQTLTLATVNEPVVVSRNDIEEMRESNVSLMPEGMLDLLKDEQVRDLVGYLMSPAQVPLSP